VEISDVGGEEFQEPQLCVITGDGDEGRGETHSEEGKIAHIKASLLIVPS
jgi:hypothetical protein